MIMNDEEFKNPDNWRGGYYELSMEFHPVGNDKRINDALVALQECKFFNGIWHEKTGCGVNSIALPIKIETDSVTRWYGALDIYDGMSLPCMVAVIRAEGESNWIDISIPHAILESKFAYRYPLTKDMNPWQEELDERLIRLAEMVYSYSPFDLAMIGDEITGYTNQATITVENLGQVTCLLPNYLRRRLGVEGKGEGLTNSLVLYKHE